MNAAPIFISGVGRRAGLHLASTFLSRGIPIIGTYRQERSTIEELRNRGAELYQCDFNDEPQVKNMIDAVKQQHNNLRAIIHNASEWLPDDADVPASEVISRMMNVHVHVPYLLNLEFASLLQDCPAEYSDIVHISDFTSSRGSKKHIAYAASKASQDNLTLSFAAKLAPKVKVNSVAPALVLFNEDDDEPYRKKALKKSLLQREGGLAEFQKTIDYILESSYVTGRVHPLDGGRHLVY